MVPMEGYIFTFFREDEGPRSSSQRISRVGRVCRQDRGGPTARDAKWLTSYVKARLACAMPGDNPFYFDEIRAISDVFQVNGHSLFYGLFTTADNNIYGSAVCLYDFEDINKVFRGNFAHNSEVDVKANDVPEPRPGQCVNDSTSLPQSVIDFNAKHPTMSSAIKPVYERPVLAHTSIQWRYSAIAVVPQVKAVDDQLYDVLFIGTDDGKVLKALSGSPTEDPIIIEEIDVLKSNRQAVKKLQVVGNQVLVVYNSEVHALPIERCHLARSCKECVALRDPHCAWFSSQCQFQHPTIRYVASLLGNKKSIINICFESFRNAIFIKTNDVVQNVRLGLDSRCVELDSTSSFPIISNHGKQL